MAIQCRKLILIHGRVRMTAQLPPGKSGLMCYFASLFFVAGPAVIALAGCGGAETPPASITKAPETPAAVETAEPETAAPKDTTGFVASKATSAVRAVGLPEFKPFYSEEEISKNAADPHVLIKTSTGNIKIRLHKQKAPLTVDNFLTNYVETTFYKGLVFHYVEKDFMVAAGGFDEKYKPKTAGQPVMNESYNGLKNRRGTVGMIRDPGFSKSATSQFYINLKDNKELDYISPAKAGYCVFGEVVEGMDIVDRISATPVQNREGFPNSPVKPVVILSCEAVD